MRSSIQVRYAEVVDYRDYEKKVRKLLDTYIQVDEVYKSTSTVNIFEENLVKEELVKYGKTPASLADEIAHQMKKVITERMEKDEAFYKKFSELLEKIIKDFNEGRIDEKEYLESILTTRNNFQEGFQEGIPEKLRNNEEARAFFGAVKEILEQRIGKDETPALNDQLAQVGIDISAIVENLTIRDWKTNLDIQKQMENKIEDYLITKRKELGMEISFDEIDQILVKCLKVAKHNY